MLFIFFIVLIADVGYLHVLCLLVFFVDLLAVLSMSWFAKLVVCCLCLIGYDCAVSVLL